MISSLLPALPSPALPKTRSSTSYIRPATGRKTFQNFSCEDKGGGGVERDAARWVRRAGGWAVIWTRVGENVGAVRRDMIDEADGPSV